MKTLLQTEIERILSQSDIVWPKYGSETIERVAARIIAAVNNPPAANGWYK